MKTIFKILKENIYSNDQVEFETIFNRKFSLAEQLLWKNFANELRHYLVSKCKFHETERKNLESKYDQLCQLQEKQLNEILQLKNALNLKEQSKNELINDQCKEIKEKVIFKKIIQIFTVNSFKILNIESSNKLLLSQNNKLIQEHEFQIANFQREKENSDHFNSKLLDEKVQEFNILKKV